MTFGDSMAEAPAMPCTTCYGQTQASREPPLRPSYWCNMGLVGRLARSRDWLLVHDHSEAFTGSARLVRQTHAAQVYRIVGSLPCPQSDTACASD
jgi:hypothetical protein